MKQKYKINLNPTPLSKADVQKHQDFDALLAAFEATPKPVERPRQAKVRRIGWIAGAAAAAVVGLVLFLPSIIAPTATYEQAQATYFKTRPYVDAPLQEVKAQFASYTIDAATGGNYMHGEGTQLTVPAAAFEDANGNSVQGAVDLYYREMHDYIDFFLSGIPMTYDSLNVIYNLESAGMVEIYAEQDGKRVRMAKDKAIGVELAAVIDVPNIMIPPKYNIYKLDTVARNWVYQEVDKIQVLVDEAVDQNSVIIQEAQSTYRTTIAAIEAAESVEIEALEARMNLPTPPKRPRKRNLEAQTLDLDFLDSFGDSAEASAIRTQYEGAIWEVSPKSTAIPANAARINWQNFELKSIGGEEYRLRLMNGSNTLELIILPVLLEGEYAQALAAYERVQADYDVQLALVEERLIVEKEQLARKTAEQVAAAQAVYQAALDALPANTPAPKHKVINRFQATSFGVWNCDRPIEPMEQTVAVDFVDVKGKKYDEHVGYLVDKSQNTIYRFLAVDNTPLKFNANSENFLWLVSETNEIAIFTPAQFKALDLSKRQQVFTMSEPSTQDLRTEQDVRRLLSL